MTTVGSKAELSTKRRSVQETFRSNLCRRSACDAESMTIVMYTQGVPQRVFHIDDSMKLPCRKGVGLH